MFVKGSLASLAAGSVINPFTATKPVFAALQEGKGRAWEDNLRRQFEGEKIVRTVNMPNCTGSCGWNVVVKDGIVMRAEPPLDYPDD